MGSRHLTVDEAAELVGVRPSTIVTWVARGLLEPVGRSGRRHLYDDVEVAEAERTMRLRRVARQRRPNEPPA